MVVKQSAYGGCRLSETRRTVSFDRRLKKHTGGRLMTGHQNCEGVAGQMSRDDTSTGSLKLGVAVAAVIGFLVSSSVVAAAQDVSFRAAVNYEVGSNPYSVAVADFNRDGIDDLAVVNHCNDSAPQCRAANTVSILLGNGDGSFRAAQNFPTGSGPRFVAVVDFNGDGVQDLAVANERSNDVSVLLGNGDGTFQSSLDVPVGRAPTWLAVGDFNGDGLQDLAVANSASANVSVLLGSGEGSFQAAQNVPTGTMPSSVAVGDFNGDGLQDLVVTRETNISVFLGNGDGSFQAAWNDEVLAPFFSVAIGDFNGDTVQDLAVTFGAVPEGYGGGLVLLGNGDGSFRSAGDFEVGIDRYSVAVGDFNADRVEDLVVANGRFNDVSVLLGNGDGTFQTPWNFGVGGYPAYVAIGDFNRDGMLDLAVSNAGSDNVSVLINDTLAQPPVNHPPSVNAGPDQTITLPGVANLVGTVSDDGLPNPPGAVTTTWSKVSGPGTVTFGNAAAVNTTASFSAAGSYVLRLTASDSALQASDDISITVNSAAPSNRAPSVNAGPDQTITLPGSANLDGTVSDDGLPNPPGALTTTWTKVSGPGTVTFGNANAVDTTASFSAAGSYVLRLSANDSALQASDDISVTVNSAGPSNQAPSVNAGPDQTITLPGSANLDGTVSDDGLPNPPGALTTTWSKVSGPGTVTFGNANAVDTTASFSAAGNYVLRLTVNDGALQASDDIRIRVRK
jgi:FG-GAP-like repeat/FG-GAP repeat